MVRISQTEGTISSNRSQRFCFIFVFRLGRRSFR